MIEPKGCAAAFGSLLMALANGGECRPMATSKLHARPSFLCVDLTSVTHPENDSNILGKRGRDR